MTEEVTLITGVTGFLGSHVARILLEQGCHVRGTVRDLNDTAKVEAVKALCPDAKHPLELVQIDLTSDDGWDKAVLDCKHVISCATVKGKQATELPDATKRLLTVCAAAKTVTKVVLTSSHNTIAAEADNDPEKVFTEEDWTNAESSTLDPYSKYKFMSEKLAWEFVKDLREEEKFDLIVMNPSLLMGPALLESQKTTTSIQIVIAIMNKSYPGVPRISIPICDVRDAAKAHIQALSTEEASNKRHIICTKSLWMRDIANLIAKEFKPQGYSIATCQLPNFVLYFAGIFSRQVKHFVIPRLGKEFRLDNSRMTDILKVEPTPIEDTLHDMAYSLIDIGIVHKAKKYKQAGSRAETPQENGKEQHDDKEMNGTNGTTGSNGTNGFIKEKLQDDDKEEKEDDLKKNTKDEEHEKNEENEKLSNGVNEKNKENVEKSSENQEEKEYEEEDKNKDKNKEENKDENKEEEELEK